MAKAAKCDRCGKLFDLYEVKRDNSSITTVNGFNTLIQGSWNPYDGYFEKKTYDLCVDCCKEFNEWLEEANE